MNDSHENNPRKALDDAIAWNCEVALDPTVSSDARNLIDQGRNELLPHLEMTCTWLKAALNCKIFPWDWDQHEYASEILLAAQNAMNDIKNSRNFEKVDEYHEI